MKSLLKASLARFRRYPAFTLYKYRKPDGSFDYERYRQIQIEGNHRKLGNVWVTEENIAYLADYLRPRNPRFGICHGTRRGKEQEWFRKYLGCEVIGTEISDTALQFPNTIQWDFHHVKPEWLGAVDFIYSNSFDHSYDPEKCLVAWMSCVRPGGVCIIEHSNMHDTMGASELDPFGASINLMPYLVANWSKGKFAVREILDAPNDAAVRGHQEDLKYLKFIVVQNWPT
jgi:methyltransferase family protein